MHPFLEMSSSKAASASPTVCTASTRTRMASRVWRVALMKSASEATISADVWEESRLGTDGGAMRAAIRRRGISELNHLCARPLTGIFASSAAWLGGNSSGG